MDNFGKMLRTGFLARHSAMVLVHTTASVVLASLGAMSHRGRAACRGPYQEAWDQGRTAWEALAASQGEKCRQEDLHCH